MKKIRVLMILFLILTFFISCNNSVISDEKYARKQGKTIVECFDTKDVNALKNMFSESTKEKCNLEEEIQIAFDLYEGKSISYKCVDVGIAGGTKDGEWVDKHIAPNISLETDKGNKYEIEFREYLIYKKDETMIGIKKIFLWNADGERLAVIGDNGDIKK